MKRKFSVYQTQARQAVGGSQSDFGSARSLWGNKGAPKRYAPMLGIAHDGVESGERGDSAPEMLAAREKQGMLPGTPSDFQTVASGLGTDEQTRQLAMKMGYSPDKVGSMDIADLKRELHIRFGSGTTDANYDPVTEEEEARGLKPMGTIFPMGGKPRGLGLEPRARAGTNPAPMGPGATGVPGTGISGVGDPDGYTGDPYDTDSYNEPTNRWGDQSSTPSTFLDESSAMGESSTMGSARRTTARRTISFSDVAAFSSNYNRSGNAFTGSYNVSLQPPVTHLGSITPIDKGKRPLYSPGWENRRDTTADLDEIEREIENWGKLDEREKLIIATNTLTPQVKATMLKSITTLKRISANKRRALVTKTVLPEYASSPIVSQ